MLRAPVVPTALLTLTLSPAALAQTEGTETPVDAPAAAAEQATAGLEERAPEGDEAGEGQTEGAPAEGGSTPEATGASEGAEAVEGGENGSSPSAAGGSDESAPSPEPAEPAPTMPVLITSTPGAEVQGPDGVSLGATPLEAALPVGTHRLSLVAGEKTVVVYLTVLGEDAANRVLVDLDAGKVVAAEGRVRADVDLSPGPVPAVAPSEQAEPRSRACPNGKPCVSAGSLAVWPKLRLRAGYELQQPDPNVLFIGNHDGFRLDQARFGFGGAWGDSFRVRVTVDAATFFPDRKPNEPIQPLLSSVVDAYMVYQPIEYFGVWVGQTFMPSDTEGSTSRARMNFSDRSVASGGVRLGRGYEVAGLSPGREIGVVMGARDARIGPVSFDYLAALSNGNGVATFGNDNKLPAAYSRLGIGWERFVVLGVGASYNPRTTGTIPTLYDETDVEGFADLRVDLFGIDFLAEALVRQTTFDSLFPEVTDLNRVALGYGATSWLVIDEPFGLPMFGIKPGARVSFYDPSTSFADDMLVEGTLSVRYDPTTYDLPIAVIVDATMLAEIDTAGLRALDNNRVVALVQFEL